MSISRSLQHRFFSLVQLQRQACSRAFAAGPTAPDEPSEKDKQVASHVRVLLHAAGASEACKSAARTWTRCAKAGKCVSMNRML